MIPHAVVLGPLASRPYKAGTDMCACVCVGGDVDAALKKRQKNTSVCWGVITLFLDLVNE